ncbi:TRAP transporter substrate-binding protein [Desulfovermiculus halophilus]|uniref:TRAP transporter substrate-binding protein n=1 Tax=Desulfovermiculus halophilus TaxID=339722 RepID=UPI000487744B|nr:TRAP transporter substrate-binding protein [Desulfovermiculus halophilus]
MNRLTALGGFILLAVLSGTVEAKEIVLNYANFPPAQTFPCVQMERWKAEVEERTNGKVQINTFPGGTLLGAKAMFRGVAQGQADIGCSSMAYLPGVFPLTSAVGLPVGFTSAETASLVLWDVYTKYAPEEFSEVKVLTMFTSAPSNLMSKKRVAALEDFQGLEIRASGSLSRSLELLGATPVSMPMSETPEALQKGVVQGLLSSLEVLKDFNYAAYCPYQTILNLQVYPFAVVMNKDVWNSLPADVQEVMNDLGPEQAEWTGEYMDRHVQEALAYAQQEHSTQVDRLPDTDMREMQAKVAPIIEEWKQEAADAGLPAEEIYQDMLALKERYAQDEQ